jgi:DNA polymerase III alpha subunit
LLTRVAFQRRELGALLWSGALDEVAGLGLGDHPWVHAALWSEWSRGQCSSPERVIAEARRGVPTAPPQLVARYSGLSRVQNELRYLEMHISDHPMRLLRSEAERLSCVTSVRLVQHVDQVVSFAGIVAATRSVAVAERGALQFVTFEDEHGLIEARLPPDEWKRLHPLLSTPGPYLLRGRVQRRLGALYLDILELLPFHQRRSQLPVSVWGAATGLD